MNISKEYLVEEYINKDRTMVDLANELGITKSSLWYQLKKHGLLNTESKKHIKRGVNENIITEDNVNIAYLAGLTATDGYVDRGNLITITMSGEDGLKLLNELSNKIGYKGSIATRENHGGFSNKPFYEFTITSEKLKNHLKNVYNIHGKKKDNLDRFPDNLIYMKEDIQKSFILGIFDGDGTLDVNRGRYQITEGNENFLNCIKEYLNKKFNIDLCTKYRTDREGNYPYLMIPRDISKEISTWMYSTDCVKLKYKYDRHTQVFE